MALGQSPWHLFPILFVAIPVLYWLGETRGPSGGFSLGWLAGLGYFSVALFWIVEPFLVDAARHGWMAPFALALMAGGLALFWAVGFSVGRIGRRGGLAGAAMLAGGWTLAEYGRTTLLTGFPWALAAYVWDETPIMQGAAFLGPHGLGLATLLVAALPLAMKPRILGLVLTVGIAVVTWIGLDRRAPDEIAMTNVSLRIVQPNVDQKLKWRPEHAQRFFDRLIELTQDNGGVDAVIWPEASVPYLINERDDLNAAIAAAAGPDGRLILGALARDEESGGVRNGLAVLAPDGGIDHFYVKHHLVPFGEYLPLPDLFEKLGLAPIAAHAGRLVPGQKAALLAPDGLPPFQPLICYEAIFPHEVLGGVERPQWLLQVTNDAWFGTISGPYQHLTQARFRAVEQGLPVVRAANTGISTVIGPHGRTGAFLSLGEMGVIDSLLPAALPPTLYGRMGDGPALLGAVLLFLLGLIFTRPKVFVTGT